MTWTDREYESDPIPADDYSQWSDSIACQPENRCAWESKMCATCEDVYAKAYALGESDFAVGIAVMDGYRVYRACIDQSYHGRALEGYGHGWGRASLRSTLRIVEVPFTEIGPATLINPQAVA